MSLKVFGQKLKELRIKKGLTQEILGEKINVGAKQMSRYENGEVLPDYDKMMILKKELEYDFYCLLCDEKQTKIIIDSSALTEIKDISLESLSEIKQIVEGQCWTRAEIRAFGEYQVMRDAGNSDKTRREIMAQINRLVKLNATGGQKRDNLNGRRK